MSLPLGEYFPKHPVELGIYEGLWKVANPSGGIDIGGGQAVEFFKKSGVDMGILKQIWGLSTPVATMNVKQFFSALRYITMIQNGEIPISKGFPCFLSSSYFSSPMVTCHLHCQFRENGSNGRHQFWSTQVCWSSNSIRFEISRSHPIFVADLSYSSCASPSHRWAFALCHHS